jgi:transposase
LRLCCRIDMVASSGGVFDEEASQVKERICFPPDAKTDATGPPKSRWTLALIREQFAFLGHYSLPGVSLWLHGVGIKLRQGRPQYYSPDPLYEQKEGKLLDALHEVGLHPKERVALLLDEITYTLWPEPSRNWCEQAPAPRPLADRKKSSYKRYRVVGALNALSGQVNVLQGSRISGEVFSRFLRQLNAAYPKAKIIYLIWDNWPVHSCDAVQTTLSQLPRLRVISLPTYAPWLNPIEKLWRKFRQEIDYLHPLADDWKGLRQRVQQFFDQFAHGSIDLLRYIGLLGTGKLASALQAGP